MLMKKNFLENVLKNQFYLNLQFSNGRNIE